MAAAASEVISIASSAPSSASSVQLIQEWDATLRITSTFKVAYEIFNGGKYKNPKLAEKRALLSALVTAPAVNFFPNESLFGLYNRVRDLCRSGQYSSVNARDREWVMEFVARHLALLLALHSKAFPEQYDSSKGKANSSNAPTKSSKMKRARKTPSHLELAFDKLLAAYNTSKIQYDKEKLATLNRIHRTPSLNLQKTGPRIQDSVYWNPLRRDNGFDCPNCFHGYTMCVEINSDVNRENDSARRRQIAAATKQSGAKKGKGKRKSSTEDTSGGDVEEEQEYKAAKHGCYCQTFNCFGKVDGFGCPECVLKASRGAPPTVNPIVTGSCRWDCEVCACMCICTFDQDKRQTIANAIDKNSSKEFNNRPLSTANDAASFYVDLMGSFMKSHGKQQMLEVEAINEEEEPTDEVTTNACSLAAMSTFGDEMVHANPMVREGVRQLIGPKRDMVMWRGDYDSNVAQVPKTLAPVPKTLAQAKELLKMAGKVSKKNRGGSAVGKADVVDHTPTSVFITNSSSNNRMKRNKLVPLPLLLPQTTTVATTSAGAAAAELESTEKAPMYVRARKLAAKISRNAESSPATKSVAEAVRVSLAKKDESLVTLIEDVEPTCTQDAYEACADVVKHWKSN